MLVNLIIIFISLIVMTVMIYRCDKIYKYHQHAARHWQRHYSYVMDALRSQTGVMDDFHYYMILPYTANFFQLYSKLPSFQKMLWDFKSWSYQDFMHNYDRTINSLSKHLIDKIVSAVIRSQ